MGVNDFMLLFTSSSYAQSQDGNQSTKVIGAIAVAVVALIMLIVAIYALRILNVVIRTEEEKRAKEQGIEIKPELTLWQRIFTGC